MINLDLSKVSNIQFEDVDTTDYPDFCDAFISSAEYDGREMTDEEIEWLNEYEQNDFKYESLMDYIF